MIDIETIKSAEQYLAEGKYEDYIYGSDRSATVVMMPQGRYQLDDHCRLVKYTDSVEEAVQFVAEEDYGILTNADIEDYERSLEWAYGYGDDDYEYKRMGVDYSPSCPWLAEGMSVRDFF